jgi:hypothetical protein
MTNSSSDERAKRLEQGKKATGSRRRSGPADVAAAIHRGDQAPGEAPRPGRADRSAPASASKVLEAITKADRKNCELFKTLSEKLVPCFQTILDELRGQAQGLRDNMDARQAAVAEQLAGFCQQLTSFQDSLNALGERLAVAEKVSADEADSVKAALGAARDQSAAVGTALAYIHDLLLGQRSASDRIEGLLRSGHRVSD